MRIDLHTHSHCSDGTDTPCQLVRRAKKKGLDVVALTDHDTVAGWDEAMTAATSIGITLIKGAEFSTSNLELSQHLLGYEFDPTHTGMAVLLREAAGSRQRRVERIHDALADAGRAVDEDSVMRLVIGGGLPNKKHFARAVSERYRIDEEAVYDDLLGEGQPASIRRWKPTTEEAIMIIKDAGGVAVLAHPRARGLRVNDADRIAQLVVAGLSGLEVEHPDHAADDRGLLLELAEQHGLVPTGASDYHGTNKDLDRFDLGSCTTSEESLMQLLPEVLSQDPR